MLTNKEFIEHFVNSLKYVDRGVGTALVQLKDLNSTTIYASTNYNNFFGQRDKPVGKCVLPEEYDTSMHIQSLSEEKIVIQQRLRQSSFNTHSINGKMKLYVCNKDPVINPDTQDVVGIYCVFDVTPVCSLNNLVLRAHKIYNVGEDIDLNAYKLTKREKQVIFLFLSGLSSAEIAQVLTKITGKLIGKSTVDNIFTLQLRVKFGVFTRIGLFAKLFHLGFYRLIPQELLVSAKVPLYNLDVY